MRFEVPFCDTPAQSAAVGVLARVAGGGVGLAAGLESPGVAAVATALAVGGAPPTPGDDQFRAAVRQITGRRYVIDGRRIPERGGAEPDRSRVARPSHSGPCGPSLKLL